MDVTNARKDEQVNERDCPAMKRRIDEGERRVRQMDESGRDVAAWEAFWLELLRAYQTLCTPSAGEREGATTK